MHRTRFLFFLVLSMVPLAGLVARLAAADPPRPNILYFYVDDMGWGSIGPNGQAKRREKNLPSVHTPNLDRLAKAGVNFTRGYGCHVCSPARSSQQSGFHQGHTFADRNDPNNAKKAMRADDILMGDALSQAGYTTGYWGKWGYGGSKDQNNPKIENVQTLPTSHGYQHVLAELHHVRAHTFFQPTLWHAPANQTTNGGLQLVPNSLKRVQHNKAYPESPALQNHQDYPSTAYCDDAYAFAALDFVRAQGQEYNRTGKPFFGLLAVQIPHAPFGEITSLPNWNQAYAKDPHFKSLSPQAQQWAAMVTRIDAHFGNILAALEDPNNDGNRSDSIASNTLVVFQSDNGGPGGKSNVELDANGGLTGTKGRIQEGGIRVPLVMRWPARINSESSLKAGSNCHRVVDVTDLLPTFCEVAHTTIPLGIDGVSIAPTLTGEGIQRKRDFIIHEAGNGQSIIQGKYKLVRARRGQLSLFDLDHDPAEQNDISDKHSEMVNELQKLLLGERVTEPKGFANTYHRWTGKNGAVTSDSQNWSDYRYANAGVTYMLDEGLPQLSWITRMENKSDQRNAALAEQDLEVLALELRGHEEVQALVLSPDVNLVARNEIRLSKRGSLTVNGGTISTLRWIDILKEGSLVGEGSIEGTVFNQGSFSVDHGKMKIDGDYNQSKEGKLTISLPFEEHGLAVTGQARIQGQLEIKMEDGYEAKSGLSVQVLTANRLVGKFSNPGEVVATDGSRFAVKYSQNSVTLVKR